MKYSTGTLLKNKSNELVLIEGVNEAKTFYKVFLYKEKKEMGIRKSLIEYEGFYRLAINFGKLWRSLK